MSLYEWIHRQPQWLVLGASSALACLIGWVDYVTGWEWSFFVFYALPIVFVVWKAGQRIGFVFALFCAVIWWLAQIGDNPYRTEWGLAMAVASRLFYFGVLVIAVAAVESRRELDRARIASLERTADLEREILRTSEREQQRIGRDLHDSLGPHLAAIGYAVNFLADDLRMRGGPEVVKAQQIGELVGEAISLTRGMARGVFPVQMDSSGLAAALEDLAAMASKMNAAAVKFYETGDTLVTDPEAAMHLYRIAQEAVANAVKHSGAREISVSLNTLNGTTRLCIADNGRGIAEPTNGAHGIGLHSMRYRARAVQGGLRVDSRPGEGTIVTCEILSPSAPFEMPTP